MSISVKWSAVTAALLLSSSAAAQEVTMQGGAVAGKLISESVFVDSGPGVVVLTTPSAGFFVLTLFCADSGPLLLEGSTFGFIAEATSSCVSLLPGVALPAGEAVECVNLASKPLSCQVTGVLSQR